MHAKSRENVPPRGDSPAPLPREDGLLSEAFVAIPYRWFRAFAALGLRPADVVVLLQILAIQQAEGRSFVSPFDLGRLCGMSADEVSEVMSRLTGHGWLAVEERVWPDGTRSARYDLSALHAALWQAARQQEEPAPDAPSRDPVTLFEAEFGRPLSAIECEQIRQWLDRDQYPEWLIREALREAVLANKLSFKYIDRILFDWQRHQVRTPKDLEQYRREYRQQQRAKEEAAATRARRTRRNNPSLSEPAPVDRDERYSAFYELFPDA
ncbi:hypothetical protein GCM10010885_15500 [Alicyclobacillus cellulosilyticus]|uniref:DNA replication protein DnaD n=1 Tax=Alicyclobacillus cellulosilyticus TaxID=1003997 RepID=A0A917KAU6_9BACL|nr:DnaD domain protein [Alicyclobacillus cellulosilyticus]GGJ07261.1 hypothetical protein GCM10010885_15500 [Alicyclobacillus cellulosilyticus]